MQQCLHQQERIGEAYEEVAPRTENQEVASPPLPQNPKTPNGEMVDYTSYNILVVLVLFNS